MNVVLIGYRGTGKSSVARILGRALERRVVHTDDEVVSRVGRPIPDYVAAHGWDAFRDVESDVCLDAAREDDLVIDTGGGVVLRPENVAVLRATGWIVWLTASTAAIADRIRDDHNRPSLTGDKSFVDEIEEVLAHRLPLYRAAADFVVDTEGMNPEGVADVVRRRLEETTRA